MEVAVKRHSLHAILHDSSVADIYQQLARDVAEARRRHFQDVGQDARFGMVAVAHYRQRMKRSRLPVSLGESVPTIFGELLEVEPRMGTRFSAAWMCLYHHSLLVDDLADGHIDPSARVISVAEGLRDRAIELWRECDGLSGSLAPAFETFYLQQIEAGADPIGLEHSLGRRGALTKFYVSVLMSYRLGRTLEPHEDEALEQILAGFQILDDATDRGEDGVVLSRTRSGQPIIAEANRFDVLQAGSRSVALLSSGVTLLGAPPESHLARFIDDYIARIHDGLRSGGLRAPKRPVLPVAAN